MSLIPAMFQYIRKLVGANEEKQVAFAPLATPFTNEDFLFMNSEVYQKDPTKFYAESLEFSQKANSIIRKPSIWEIDSRDFLYTKFDEILANARLIEQRDFTDAERAAQEKAKKVLYGPDNLPTAEYKTYKVFEQQFNEIKRKIELHKNSKTTGTAEEQAAWNATLNDLENELRDKEIEWSAIGYKIEIGNAVRAFGKPRENLEREAFAAKWVEAKNFMNTIKTGSIIAGSAIFPMECIPNNLYQYKGTTWAKVTLNGEEIKKLTEELKQTSGTIDIAMMFGDTPFELDKLSFEICRVIFSRSWFNETMLTSRYWDYPQTVSTGEKDNFDGEIPAYPTEFILVKNVDFTLAPDSPVNEDLKQKIKPGLPLALGPFILKNSFRTAVQNRPVAVQTFTHKQVNAMARSLQQNPAGARSFPLQTDLQILQRLKTSGTIQNVVVHDHRTGAGGLRPGGFQRPGGIPRPEVANRPGFVWVPATPTVAGHWERERADRVEPVKVEPVRVWGKVVDEEDHSLSDAEITIIDTASSVSQNDLTDGTGVFTIENVTRGNYHVTVKKDGYSVIEKEVAVSADVDLGKMNLSSDHPVESFLLLGVVYKKLPKLPNPLPNEVYS